MSFPSAAPLMQQGKSPEEALYFAMQNDTNVGFAAISAVAEAVKQGLKDPLAFVREKLSNLGVDVENHVLRWEQVGQGIAMDFLPASIVGGQIARLMGTDAARPLLVKNLEIKLGFANCCKVIVSERDQDILVSAEQQVFWQVGRDC